MRARPGTALRRVSPAVLASLCLLATAAHADCIDDAAKLHGVNAHVLRAIGWHESRLQPLAVAVNRNGTRDIGAFQINSSHLPRLATLGVAPAALTDGCVSASVAAWHYAQQVARLGNTWQAVGAYHSRTPARNAWYANAIARVLMGWGLAPPGALPFDPARTLAPSAVAAARPAPLRASVPAAHASVLPDPGSASASPSAAAPASTRRSQAARRASTPMSSAPLFDDASDPAAHRTADPTADHAAAGPPREAGTGRPPGNGVQARVVRAEAGVAFDDTGGARMGPAHARGAEP